MIVQHRRNKVLLLLCIFTFSTHMKGFIINSSTLLLSKGIRSSSSSTTTTTTTIQISFTTVSAFSTLIPYNNNNNKYKYHSNNNNNNKQKSVQQKLATTILSSTLILSQKVCMSQSQSTSTSLDAIRRNRGLEISQDSASPQPGGMELYIKAGPDGINVGDCPFGHYVRIVLEEKNLEYTVKPCIQETKPFWLIDYYNGKMPALRHRKECYIESDTIVKYLDFFFPESSVAAQRGEVIVSTGSQEEQMESQVPSGSESALESDTTTTATATTTVVASTNTIQETKLLTLAENVIDGLFPAIAKYIKYNGDDDTINIELYNTLQTKLNTINDHLVNNVLPTLLDNQNTENQNQEFYLTGPKFNVIVDAKLLAYLYTMTIACTEFKETKLKLHIPTPLQQYITNGTNRISFQKTKYDPSIAIWGWNNARNS